MPIPVPNPCVAFDITRLSHVVLTCDDIDATSFFYEQVLGFVVTARSDDAVYLRGVEESCHHSLVFRKSSGNSQCLRIGLRVYSDEDVRKAYDYFSQRGVAVEFVDVPFQGPTIHVTDGVGTPLELCARMQQRDSMLQVFHEHRAGSPLHLDHVQIVTHEVQTSIDWYSELGFRLTEYTAKDGTDELWGVWIKRKNTTQDLVFSNGRGPRLHHFAFSVADVSSIIRAADVAASLGFAPSIERGPGRHGIANAMFIYFRDPNGHRVELFTSHYLAIDSDFVPKRWDLSDTSRSQLWGLPATRAWFFEATEFAGASIREPLLSASPVTLEDFLQRSG